MWQPERRPAQPGSPSASGTGPGAGRPVASPGCDARTGSTSAASTATCWPPCPRPAADGDEPVAAVRAILADVRERGDEAVRELHRALRRRRARRPARCRPRRCARRPRARSPAGSATPSRWRADAIEAYHRTQRARPTVRHERNGIVVRSLRCPSTGPAATCPAAGPSTRPPCYDRGAGQGGRRGRGRAVRAARPHDRPPPDVTLAAAAIAGVDEVYRDRRRPGHRRHGLRHRVDRARSTSSSGRATSTSRWPSARSPARAGRRARRPSPGRREVVVVADDTAPARPRRHRRRRAGRARPRRPGLARSPGTRRRPTPIDDAVGRARGRRSPRRAEIEATLADGGYAVLVDGPEQAMAVANAIAPEHLELHDRRPRGARAAGAPRRRGVLRPVGAGLARRLPRRAAPRAAHATARPGSAAPSPSTTSSSTCTSSPSTEAASAALAPTWRRWPRPRAATPTPSQRAGCRARAAMTPRPGPRRPRGSWRATTRPRSTSRVRLNTNESPEPPPAGVARRARRRAVARRVAPLPRPRRHRRCARPSPSSTASAPSRSSPPTARTRCCRRCCSPTAAPGRTVATFEPTYQLHGHIARLTGTDGGRGRAGRRLHARPRPRCDRVLADADPVDHVPVLAQQPDRAGRAARPSCARCSTLAPGLRRGRRGLRPVRRRGRRSTWSTTTRPLVVTRTFSKTWSMAAARLGYLVGPSWLVAELDKVVLPYHLDAAKQIAGRLALRLHRRDGGAGRRPRRGARAARRRAWPSCPSTCGRRGANFVLFRPARRATATTSGRPARPRRARARLLVVAPPRRLPAGHDRHPGRGRRLPRRPGGGAGDERRTARRASAPTKETDDRRRARPRRHRRAPTVSTGHAVLRPHARPARPPRRLRPHGRRPPATSHDRHATTPSRTSASCSARRSARRSATRPACAGSPAAAYPLDEALVEVALDLSGRPFVVWEVALPARCMPLGDPPFDPQLAEHVLAVVRHRRRHHAARDAACAGATPTTSSRPRSRASPAACATRCGSRAAACRRPRACL